MAQERSVCGICEESSIPKWICIECDLFLCQDCFAKFHSKSKTLAHHLVIDIKEYGTEQTLDKILKVKIKEINCEGSEHCIQKCSIFCLDCQKPICSSCVVNHHQHHHLHELSNIFEEKVSKFKDMKVRRDDNILKCKQEEQELKVLLSKGNKQFDETKELILQSQKELLQSIQNHIDELLKDQKTQWNFTRETINREINLIQGNIQQMEDQEEQSNRILNPHQISQLLTTSLPPIPECLLSKHVYLMSMQQAKFIQGQLLKKTIWNYNFGRLYKGPNYKIIGSYSTKMGKVSKIIHFQNNSGIIANYEDELLQKVKFGSDEIKVENKINTKVFDLALMPDGKLLVSKETSDLELISMNGDRELFHSFSPLLTFGVNVCKDEIFVGVAKSLEKSKKYKDGGIVVLDMKGQIKRTLGKEVKSGKSFFNCPTRIVANSDIICVIDNLKSDTYKQILDMGRIVGINHKGEEQWTYSDKSGFQTERFYPQDITFTSAGLILASEYWHKAIHAINKDGDITGWIDLSDIAYSMYPMSLDVDDQGTLWVGVCVSDIFSAEVKTSIYSFKLL